MKSLRIIYHLARADFLERVRRYSFLAILGLVVWLGYAVTTGHLVIYISTDYVGEINSPWVGALMAVTVVLFLGWFGFYLVKSSVSRDYETGVGQIIATTPLSRPLYTLGKWLSNFAVLGIMLLILIVAGIAMNVLFGKAPLDLWALIAPLLLVALPCLAIVAALAVLFETIGWLRGGFGNIVYFFMYLMLIYITASQPLMDFMGTGLIGNSIFHAAQAAYPEIEYSIGVKIVDENASIQRFRYDGIDWTTDVVLSRLLFILAAFGLAMLASAFFDRFDSSRVSVGGRKRDQPSTQQVAVADVAPISQVHLTPLAASVNRFGFQNVLLAELKLLFWGQRWWWYLAALGFIILGFTENAQTTREIILPLTWVWPILIWSTLGNRETYNNVHQMTFSSAFPLWRQLPAQWLAGFIFTLTIGSGAALRFLISSDTTAIFSWLAGALFIPSLALALGVWSKTRKTFEIIYLCMWYIGPISHQSIELDFINSSGIANPMVFALISLALIAFAFFGRKKQLRT